MDEASKKRILRNTTRSIEAALRLTIDLASDATNAYGGMPEAVLFERLYLSIRSLLGSAEFNALKDAGIPSDW